MALLDRVPVALRWVLFLPVGLLGALSVNTVVVLMLGLAGAPNTPQSPGGMAATAVERFVAGLTVTLFPATLSPRPWPVGMTLLVIGVMLALSPFAIAFSMPRFPSGSMLTLALANLITYAAGAALAMFALNAMLRKRMRDGRSAAQAR